MTPQLKIKNSTSTTVPTLSATGEIAICTLAGSEKLYTKNSAGNTVNLLDWSKVASKPNTLSGYGIVDSISNLTGNLYTDRLTEKEYIKGNTTKTIRPLFDILRADRTAFLPADQIIIEQSIDGGVTWTDAGYSDDAKKRLFTGQRPAIKIPLKGGVKSCDCMVRVTITAMKYNVPVGTSELNKYTYWNSSYISSTERYCNLTEGWVWLTSNSDSIYMKAERATGVAPNTWITDREAYMSGWSGGNGFSLSGSVFGGGTTQTGNYWNWRFTFRTCTNNNTFVDASLSTSNTTNQQEFNHIKLSGPNCWVTSNQLMYNDHLYSWDDNKNVTFPCSVTATSFVKSGGTSSQILLADGTTANLSAGNSYSLSTIAPSIPYIKADGVMEVGKFIDFHESTSSDYTTRLISENGALKVGNAKLWITDTSAYSLQIGGGMTLGNGSTYIATDSDMGCYALQSSYGVGIGNAYGSFIKVSDDGYITLQSDSVEINANTSFTGNIVATGEITAYQASDIRLKQNIVPIEKSLDVIDKINPVTYNWNDKAKELNSTKTDDIDSGLIAQELEKITS